MLFVPLLKMKLFIEESPTFIVVGFENGLPNGIIRVALPAAILCRRAGSQMWRLLMLHPGCVLVCRSDVP